jgi:hypothetical protein
MLASGLKIGHITSLYHILTSSNFAVPTPSSIRVLPPLHPSKTAAFQTCQTANPVPIAYNPLLTKLFP